MGSGQSATNVMTSAAGQMGQNEASNLYNAGAARASGYVGSANALGGALSSIGQMAVSYPLYQAQIGGLNRMGTGGGYGGLMPQQQTQQASPSTPSSSSSTAPTAGPAAFNRGGRAGYVGGGVIDSNDLAALQSQAIANLAPHAAGIPGQTLPGGQTAIPNKLLHVPKMITSDYRPPAPVSPFEHAQRAVAFAEGVNKLAAPDTLTRSIYDWGKEKIAAKSAATAPSPSAPTNRPLSAPTSGCASAAIAPRASVATKW